MGERMDAYDPAFPTKTPPTSPRRPAKHNKPSKENSLVIISSESDGEKCIPESSANRTVLQIVPTNSTHCSVGSPGMAHTMMNAAHDGPTFINPTNKEYWQDLKVKSPHKKPKVICLVCQIEFPVNRLKPHFLKEHIPWYMQLYYGQDIHRQCQTTRLKELASPLFTQSLKSRQMPVMCCVTLWGQLIHTFLVHLASGLGLKRPQELSQFVMDDVKCHPQGSPQTRYFAVQCYIRVMTECERVLRVSPPSSVEGFLHWTTLMNIVSKMPQNYIHNLNKFEGFCLSRIIRKPQPSQVHVPKDVKARFVHQLVGENISAIDSLLQQWPMLLHENISDTSTAGAIWYSLDKGTCGEGRIARLLVLHGASPDKPDGENLSPLHCAVMKGDKNAVQTLCEIGATLDLKTPAGLTAFELAKTKDPRILQILAEAWLKLEREKNNPSLEEASLEEGTYKPSGNNCTAECLVCKEQLPKFSLREHFLTKHVPWYIHLASNKTAEGNKSSWMKELLTPLLIRCSQCRPGRMITGMSCLAVWGQLIHNFLLHLTCALGLEQPDQLHQFVVYDSVNFNAFKKIRKFAVECYIKFVEDSGSEPRIAPKKLEDILCWNILMNIVSRIPKEYISDLDSYEVYSLSMKSQCLVIQTATGLGMFKPSPTDIPWQFKRSFVDLLNGGNMMSIDTFIQQWPGLVHIDIPQCSNAGAIWYTLDKGLSANGNIARLLFLLGASPDHLNDNKLTPLHCAVIKGDKKAVQVLCELGAQLDLETPGGLTAFDFAESKDPAIRQILYEARLKLDQNKNYCTKEAQLGKTQNKNPTFNEIGNENIWKVQKEIAEVFTEKVLQPTASNKRKRPRLGKSGKETHKRMLQVETPCANSPGMPGVHKAEASKLNSSSQSTANLYSQNPITPGAVDFDITAQNGCFVSPELKPKPAQMKAHVSPDLHVQTWQIRDSKTSKKIGIEEPNSAKKTCVDMESRVTTPLQENRRAQICVDQKHSDFDIEHISRNRKNTSEFQKLDVPVCKTPKCGNKNMAERGETQRIPITIPLLPVFDSSDLKDKILTDGNVKAKVDAPMKFLQKKKRWSHRKIKETRAAKSQPLEFNDAEVHMQVCPPQLCPNIKDSAVKCASVIVYPDFTSETALNTPNNDSFADVSIHPVTASAHPPEKRKGIKTIPVVTQGTVPKENISKHPPQKMAQTPSCAICGRKDFVSLRVHALREHLPWYIGMQHIKKAHFQKTKLSQKIGPLVGGALAANSLPSGLPSLLWAQLCHGLLYFISYKLRMAGPFELLAYTVKHYILVAGHTELEVDGIETMMKTLHSMYLGEVYQPCPGPPSSLSQLLQPYILLHLISLLSQDSQEECLHLETLADINGTPIPHPVSISKY